MQVKSSWSNYSPSKGAAFSIHLALSLLIFSSLVFMMVLYWFPGELFFIDGGWQGLKLVAMVDLVLGPALTLLLYKPGKPKLVLDMSLIAVIQIAALGYGFYTTYQQRTVALVYAERGFNTVSARDNLEANAQLRQLDINPQPIPAVTLLNVPLLLTPPPAPGKYAEHLNEIFNGYPGPQRRSDQYVSLESNHESMQKDALDIETLNAMGAADVITAALQRKSLELNEVELYKFKARYADGVAVFDPDNKRILDFVPIEKVDKPDESPVVAENEES
ncbi:MAG: hypothetical protein AB8B84_06915 [Granulosicoccus sp.]